MTIIVPAVAATATPTKTIASMVPDISVFLQGCPSPVIERTILKIATDLCQRAKVWSLDAVPITLVPGAHEYDLTFTEAYAEPTDIETAYLILSDGSKVDLPMQPYGAVAHQFPSWPQNAPGQPQMVTRLDAGKVLVAPVPEETADLYVRCLVRPVATATVLEQWLYDEFRRVIHHGVLHELLLMPQRSWSNPKLGEFHGRQWTYLLNNAKARATLGYNRGSISVEMRPFA